MLSRKDIPKDSLYHYSKQVREVMDAQMAAEDRVEAIEENAKEKTEARKNAQLQAEEKIEDRKSALETKKLAWIAIWISIASCLLSVLIGILQLYFQVKN